MSATTLTVELSDISSIGSSKNKRAVETVNGAALRYLRRVYESHAGHDQKWGSEQTKTFLRAVQHCQVAGDLESLVAKPELDFNGFLDYMTSVNADITLPARVEDLSWPLASYFISSSHNTYLSGNQLSSISTADSYTNVLRRGCRCVEIDVWNGNDQESDASDGSSSDDDRGVVGAVKAAAAKRKQEGQKRVHRRYNSLKDRLPSSLLSRLEKTSLGKRLDKQPADGAAVKATQGNPKPAKPEVGLAEPRVLHGYTLTKEVSFRDVCVAIRDNAFVASDLPVIVSLEVHCNAQQQAVMVDIMKQVWEGLLVLECGPVERELPAPGTLKKKILVKVKYAAPQTLAKISEKASDTSAKLATNKKKKKGTSVIQELSRLGIYTKGVSFKSYTQPEASMATHVFSLSEKKFRDHHQNQRAALFKHNRNFMMRAYPAGFRINSSNLNPAPFWGAGTQVVALNWQQTDQGTMLNEGMFAGTGGYVLKPEGYRPDTGSKASSAPVKTSTLNLTLTFLAIQSVPVPAGDTSQRGFKPYVKVEIHVDGSDGQRGEAIKNEGHEREGEYKARTLTASGGDADMKEEKMEFKGIKDLVDELTFVRFTIRDDEIGRDELAAWACVRLDRLGQGYRFIHLRDSKGRDSNGVILVKVERHLTEVD